MESPVVSYFLGYLTCTYIYNICYDSSVAHGEVYMILHYVITFVSDLRQVDDFLRFPPPIQLTTTA